MVSTAFDAVRNSIGSAVDRYDTLNRFPKMLQQLGFSTDDAAAATDKLKNGVMGLPTPLDDVVATAQRLTILTGNLEKSTDTTLALNNAFLASGSSTADASRGLMQYVQMLSKGSVDMQSWRTLQETMGYALNETAKAFGFAGESAQNDLYEALKHGDITFDQFNAKLNELNEATGGFAEVAKVASTGLKTSWTNMQTAITRAVTSIITSINDNLVKRGLPDLGKAIEMVGSGFEKFITKIGVVAGHLVSTLSPAIALVVTGFKVIVPTVTTIIGILDTLSPAILAVSAAYATSKAIDTWKDTIQAANQVMLAAEMITGAMTLSLGANATAETIRTAAKAAGMTVDAQGNIITAAGVAITEAEAAALLASTGSISLKTLAVGVLSGQISIAAAAEMLWGSIMQSSIVQWTMSTASTIANTVATTAKSIATGILTGQITVQTIATAAATAAQWLWNAAMTANPIGIIIVAIAAFIAGVVALVKWLKSESTEQDAASKSTENLADSHDDLTESVNANEKAIESLAKITSNMFEQISTDSEVSLHEMTQNLLANQNAARDWSSNVEKLVKRGIDEGLIAKLRDGSEESIALAATLAKSSEPELQRFSRAWARSGEEAANAMSGSLKDPTLANSGKEMVNNIAKNVEGNKSLNNSASKVVVDAQKTASAQVVKSDFPDVGRQMIEGMKKGAESQSRSLIESISKIMNDAAKSARKALDIHSPSKVFGDIGENTIQGFIGKVTGMSGTVSKAIDNVFGNLGGNVDFGTAFDTDGNTSRNLNSLNGMSESTVKPSGQTVINIENFNVSSDDMEDSAKVVRIFENLAQDNTAYGGVY